MLSVLSEKEKAVIETITMRFHAPEALTYLENLGMKMGLSTYYRYRKIVEDKKIERMQFIADHFQELHLEKIDRLELIDRLMWQEGPERNTTISQGKDTRNNCECSGDVSGYYESSTIALEVSAKFNGTTNKNKKNDYVPMSFDDWTKNNILPRISDDSYYSEEENGQYYWNLHKKYNEYVKDWNTQNFGPDPNAEEQREIESRLGLTLVPVLTPQHGNNFLLERATGATGTLGKRQCQIMIALYNI